LAFDALGAEAAVEGTVEAEATTASGWTQVVRGMSEEEAELWRGRSSIPQPRLESGFRTYVSPADSALPGYPVYLEFEVPSGALKPGSIGFQIFSEGRYIPIRDLVFK